MKDILIVIRILHVKKCEQICSCTLEDVKTATGEALQCPLLEKFWQARS